MPTKSSPEQLVIHDVDAAERLRQELKSSSAPASYEVTITASDAERRELADQTSWSQQRWQQSQHVSRNPGLFGVRIEAIEHAPNGVKSRVYIYFSKHGNLPPLISTDDAAKNELYLISWQHPTFSALMHAPVGTSKSINGSTWSVQSIVEVGEEEFATLRHIQVLMESDTDLFAVAKRDRGQIVVLRQLPISDAETLLPEKPSSLEATVQIDRPEEPRVEPETSRSLYGLSTTIRREDRPDRSIVFSLDEVQETALRAHSGNGLVVIVGPPGTGKTTVALMRGSTLLASLLDDKGRLKEGKPMLRKERMALFVVTPHLEAYLKSFLNSDELAMHGVQVINLRGSYLKQLFRDPTLKLWRAGINMRMSDENQERAALTYLKSYPQILNLAFYHAHQQAVASGGVSWGAVSERIKERLSKLPKIDRSEQLLAQVRFFLGAWSERTANAAVESIGGTPVWLTPGRSDLQLSSFSDGFNWSPNAPRKAMEDVVWRELVRLIDPQQVLMAVISDYRASGDRKDLIKAGLNDADIDDALTDWESVLMGKDVGDDPLDEEDTPSLPDAGEDDGTVIPRRKGALTLTDLPILACIARAILAPSIVNGQGWRPVETEDGQTTLVKSDGLVTYSRLGMHLPADLPRYDHVMVDEAQDLSYPELCFAMACTEPVLRAVTVAGDPFQRMRWENGLQSLELLAPEPGRRFEVRCNYRQTKQLMTWVKRLASLLYPSMPVAATECDRNGPPPEIECVDRPEKAAPRLAHHIKGWYDSAREPFVAVLLIGYEPQSTVGLVKALRNRLQAADLDAEFFDDGRLIERGKISVAEVPSVKGLEFDAVVVSISPSACELLDSDDPRAIPIRNQLYVACTRACNRLAVVFQGRPRRISDLLPAINPKP